MNHEEAWARLPDLLDDRDDAVLLAHVAACPDCQRQLFLLGRVDRLLRGRAADRRATRSRRRIRRFALAGSALAAAAAAAVVLVGLGHAPATQMMLRTASGQTVGHAVIGRSDARNVSLALIARDLPVRSGHVFVLWAGDEQSSMEVGHFMVGDNGGCRVHFNLPADHHWRRLWITRPDSPAMIVART